MNKITKAVIPCGGAGTRFLPVTKSVPKEILPIVDTPVLAHIIKEAADSGITDVLLILGNGKEAIKHYFTPDARLEDFLLAGGKSDLLRQIKEINQGVNIVFEYQPKPLGSGDAILRAEKFTGAEPFCIALGDDIVHSQVPVMKQLINVYDEVCAPIVGVQRVDTDDITSYGVAKLAIGESDCGKSRLFRCIGFLEKPRIEDIPSRFACLGRYVLTKEIYDELRVTKVGKGGELQLTDALNALYGRTNAYIYDFVGKRYDMGNKCESVKAVVEFALRNEEYGDKIKEYLIGLVRSWQI